MGASSEETKINGRRGGGQERQGPNDTEGNLETIRGTGGRLKRLQGDKRTGSAPRHKGPTGKPTPGVGDGFGIEREEGVGDMGNS